jgi:hypothetical protein
MMRTGLATATPQRIRAGGKVMEVATLRITEAGRGHFSVKSRQGLMLPLD